MAVLFFAALSACRGTEQKSEAVRVRSEANGPLATTSEGVLPGGAEQSDAATAAPKAASGLCLELLAPRLKFLRGEPVVLIVSLRNCSPTGLAVFDLLAPEYGFLAVFARRPGDTAEVRYEPGYVREGRGKQSRTLAPGERLTVWIPLYIDRRGWFLTRPGTYSIRSALALEDGRVESNRVTFEVAPGSSEADKRAAEIFMTPEVGRALLDGGRPGSKAWSGLSAVVEKYSESRLAPYARLAMGLAKARSHFDPATKSFQKPDCPRAVEELQPALRRLEDPLFAAQGTAALSECLQALGQEGKARQSVSDYFRSHPRARSLPGVADVFQSAKSRSSR